MSSIQGIHDTYALLLQQLSAPSSGSPTSTGKTAATPANSGDTVQLSLNQIRDEFQDARISYNEKNGKLTTDQATQLQAQISTVEQQVTSDEQADGGSLTSQQKVAINQMQNQISQQIYDTANNIAAGTPDAIPGLS